MTAAPITAIAIADWMTGRFFCVCDMTRPFLEVVRRGIRTRVGSELARQIALVALNSI